jgi:hypothetical protein
MKPKPRIDDAPARKPKPKVGEEAQFTRSKKHENRIASRLGGRRVSRSGGAYFSKSGSKKYDPVTAGGDIKTPKFYVEHKRTEHASMSVKLDWLRQIKESAVRVMKDPALAVTFEHDGKNEDWVMIPLSLFERLTGSRSDDGET